MTGNSIRCSGSQQSNNSVNAVNNNKHHQEQLQESNQHQKDQMIASTDQVILTCIPLYVYFSNIFIPPAIF
jgi:heme/copper-type cytochrome/quinol oxidase subunit 4